MSSFDQAFVQAFARRNRSVASRVAASRAAARQTVAPVPKINPIDEPGSLKVDHSVANSAQLWIDPIEDQMVRGDSAVPDVPKPHVDPTNDSVATPAGDSIEAPSSDSIEAPSSDSIEAPSSDSVATPTNESIETQFATVDEQTASSLQHIHAAYATAIADVTAASIQPTPAPAVATDTAADDPAEVQPPAPLEVPSSRIDPPAARANEPHTFTPLRAVWEVDVFDIPASVADLFFEGRLFQQIAERMSDAVSSGLNSILVTSAKSGEGRSSVAIGLAMAAAAAGIRVALVDADSDDPTLADDLRLDLKYGWVDTIRGGLPIKEVAVHAVEDGVTLIPLMPPQGRSSATGFEFVKLAELLKSKFELVVIDGPAGDSPNIHQCASVVDSAVIVRDASRTDRLAINEFSYRLSESGVQGVGIVENFV